MLDHIQDIGAGPPTASAAQFLDDSKTKQRVIEGYRDFGCAVLEDVFDDREIGKMCGTWQRISDERRSKGKKPFAMLLMSHMADPEVAAIVCNNKLTECIESLLGGRIELIQSQLMFGAPGSKGFSPHQDNFYNRARPSDGILAAWIALEPVDELNGGLAVYPGSHKRGLVETRRDWVFLLSRAPDIVKSLLRLASRSARRKPSDTGVMERFAYAVTSPGTQPRCYPMREGSVMFMHGDLIHSSLPNQSSRFRRSLVTNYVRQGTQYSAGALSGRVAFDIYADSGVQDV